MREKKTPKPKPEKKTTKKGKASTKQENSPPIPEKKDLPTEKEIEAIKDDILAHGLLNPYALILYNYMRVSSYEINVQLVASMRESLLQINKLNEIILNELTQDPE